MDEGGSEEGMLVAFTASVKGARDSPKIHSPKILGEQETYRAEQGPMPSGYGQYLIPM